MGVSQLIPLPASLPLLFASNSASRSITLQDADKAYVESGGSFKALVVSLFSSESFFYRTVPAKRPHDDQ